MSDLEYVLSCGCYKTKGAAWWNHKCTAGHERPGGHESWKVYRAAWIHVQCDVCGKFGFHGKNDFESVGMFGKLWIEKKPFPNPREQPFLFAPLIYAHRSCAALDRVFKDMHGQSSCPAPPKDRTMQACQD